MDIKPRISIVIPVFNCEGFIHQTLDSILNQTFDDWECILVDDHSTDNVFVILKEYEKKDKRFKVFLRPITKSNGANACRNHGYLQAKGSCIKWFDSDDIMLPKHLEIAYQSLIENDLDFVVTDTLNFDNITNVFIGRPYDFDKNHFLTSENFALNKIGWITDDFLGIRKIVDSVKFNENITDGDEYNFFIKVLQSEVKGAFINQTLTHRRIHSDSVSFKNRQDDISYMSILATLKYQTANDLVVYNNKRLIRWFLSGYMRISFDLALTKSNLPYKMECFKLICKYHSAMKGSAFLVALFLGSHLKKGYNIMRYARK